MVHGRDERQQGWGKRGMDESECETGRQWEKGRGNEGQKMEGERRNEKVGVLEGGKNMREKSEKNKGSTGRKEKERDR